MLVPLQRIAGRAGRERCVHDAFEAAHAVGECAQDIGLAADHDHLGAVVVIEVHVRAGQYVGVVLVLQLVELVAQAGLVVIVNQGNGPQDFFAGGPLLVDELVVGIAVDTGKESLFPIEERVAMLREVTAGEKRIRVETFSGLTVEFARARSATVILRGLRAVSDFEFEFQMALMNKHLAEEIEILFMAPDTTYSFLSSSLVREVARLGGDVTPFVSPVVARRLAERFGGAGG